MRLPLRVDLHPEGAVPLAQQLYQGLRGAILRGTLGPQDRLPSSRALAGDLHVSRNTVLAAYEQLAAEGYVDGRVGSGTRVVAVLPEEAVAAARRAPAAPRRPQEPRLCRRVAALARVPWRWSALPGSVRAFRVGVPSVAEFPVELWGRLTHRRWLRAGHALLGASDPAGYRPLREAIAGYLGLFRGVDCDADQVIVTAGTQQALDLAARVLVDPGDAVAVEDPGYPGARGAFVAAGARLRPVPVDAEGLRVEALPAAARVVYVTPAHQFPTGATMSASRRLALLDWAARRRATIVEDDYDSEFRYASRPLPALQGLDGHGRVLYCGTFGKLLFPALRLAYMVVPPGLLDAVLSARSYADAFPPALLQAVLADFIEQGHFERHVRRMRRLYAERRDALLHAGQRDLAGLVDLLPSDGGMHLVGRLRRGSDDADASARAARERIHAIPMSFCALRSTGPALLLGYAPVPVPEIAAGVRALARALA